MEEERTHKDGRFGSGDANEAPEPAVAVSGEAKSRSVIHIIVIDALILAELAFSIYFADKHRDEADFTLMFCSIFFGMVIPTILISRYVVRRFLTQEEGAPRKDQARPD